MQWKLKMVFTLVVVITFITTGVVASETEQTAIDDKTLDTFVDEPSHHFHMARNHYLQKRAKIAADEIRKGAAFLKLESGRAAEKTKEGLDASVKELEEFAEKVEKETVTSVKKLDDAFARAHHALAKHHYQRALEYWSKEWEVKAGQALKAATTQLEQGLAWTDKKMTAITVAVIKDASIIVDKLMARGQWVKKEVVIGMEKLGKEIEKFGQLLKSGKVG